MKRRILATLLSLCLLVGLLPVGAMAEYTGTNHAVPFTIDRVLKQGETTVSADKFMVYKDGQPDQKPNQAVVAGDLSETAPDLSAEDLYFDHAEVNGKRVYEVGTLDELTYYSSFSGALSVLGEEETIDLYYVTKYQVTYSVTGAEKTAGDNLVQKDGSLTFRAKPSAKGKRLVVTVNGADISSTGTVYDSTTGEMLFTVDHVQGAQTVSISEQDVVVCTLTYDNSTIRNGSITSVSPDPVPLSGTVTIEMESSYNIWQPLNRYALNMLVINGQEVATLPSDAKAGDYVETTLLSGETVRVTLTQEDTTAFPVHYSNDYTITISNVYTDLVISEVNFKNEDRDEIILKELTGIQNIVGWDYDSGQYLSGVVNMVYLQTEDSGSEFYFNLLPGYKEPKLTVTVNGQVSNEMFILK